MTLGTSILVVDDDAQIRKVLSDILGNEGYLIQTAKDGNKATHLTKKISFRYCFGRYWFTRYKWNWAASKTKILST